MNQAPTVSPQPDGRYLFSDVLFVPDIARLLRCNLETVRRMVRKGIIKPIPGCRTMRFSGAAVNRLLDSGGVS